MKSGFITIIGRPNAGKSTLTNRLVEEKVSIVTWKPQTTRDKILGIINGDGYQAVLIDTPGIHSAKNRLSDYMMKNIYNSLVDIDAVIYVIDGSKYINDLDEKFIKQYSAKVPLIVALNKVDASDREKYVKLLDRLNKFKTVHAIYSISARRGDNVKELKNEIIDLLPEGDPYFPEDMYTDKTLRFMVSEIVREKALINLNQEIPYGVGIVINKFQNREGRDLVDIDADLICERQQHKSIILGKQGSMIKKIGASAREDIEKLIGSKVFLKLYVKVEKNWRDNNRVLQDIGYDEKQI